MKPIYFVNERAARREHAADWWELRKAIAQCHRAGLYLAASILRNGLARELRGWRAHRHQP